MVTEQVYFHPFLLLRRWRGRRYISPDFRGISPSTKTVPEPTGGCSGLGKHQQLTAHLLPVRPHIQISERPMSHSFPAAPGQCCPEQMSSENGGFRSTLAIFLSDWKRIILYKSCDQYDSVHGIYRPFRGVPLIHQPPEDIPYPPLSACTQSSPVRNHHESTVPTSRLSFNTTRFPHAIMQSF